jgi:transcriptional regulator with XRE-family HTH domain
MACVTKNKNAEAGETKALLNRYVGEVIVPAWIENGGNQKELAELTGLKESAISDAKTKKSGLDLDSLERLALGMGITFFDLLRDAKAWHESPENSRIALLSITKPNRARAEAAFERLGNSPDKARVWAEAVYAGLRADEDPDPETVVQRMILEKQRDPEATGYPRLKCPNEWAGWPAVRDEFLKRADLFHLWGPMMFFGKTPTAEERPDPLEVKSILPLVQHFAARHPLTDERWTAINNACAKEARKIERKLRPQRKEQRNPITNKDLTPSSSETQITTQSPISSAPPPPKKKRD